jgi:N-acetyl-beta-hexosaminidase
MHRAQPTTNILPGAVAAVMLALLFCAQPAAAAAGEHELSLVPRPASFELAPGVCVITNRTTILIDAGSPRLQRMGGLLREAVRTQTGLELTVADSKTAGGVSRGIRLQLNAEPAAFGAEGYELITSPGDVLIRADQPAGLYYGIQTLLQLMSPALSRDLGVPATNSILLPCLRVVDRPQFAWRGLLLDCSRTFLSFDYLKKCVDVCSFYKMNVLQLHLTDDQGWRLQIRKHPRLTEVGSKFDSCFVGEVSGCYTQQQIRELVQYAAERGVTIVPEIEMPGHCLALLKSYPELSCRGGADHYVIAPYMFMSDPSPRKEPATPHGALCPGNEKTFEVLADVLAEVIELFPSEYIHIAGDECPKGFWKACPKCQARMKAEGLKDEEALQGYFVKRVAKLIQARGRKVFGWDETLEGGLAPGMALMSWRSLEAGITAAKQGHPVVMASKSHLYLDYCYNRTPASLVYSFEPVPPELDTPQLRPLVLGAEACMWTHLARSEAGIDMSLFPRLLALAEVLWTPTAERQWDDFARRMKLHEPVLKSKGVTCFARNEGLGLPNLTCGRDGRLWLVNASGEIHVRKAGKWERFPGEARQVTSGPDGAIWSVSTQPTTRGYPLLRWSEPAKEWQALGNGVAAVQIAAAPDGSLWACTEAYALWRYADGKWANVLGLAREVSVGSDGTVWILTMDPGPDGFELYSAPPGGRFCRVLPPTVGGHLAALGTGEAWVSLTDGSLGFLANGKYEERPGKLSALTATGSDKVWGLTASTNGSQRILVHWADGGCKAIGPVP